MAGQTLNMAKGKNGSYEYAPLSMSPSGVYQPTFSPLGIDAPQYVPGWDPSMAVTPEVQAKLDAMKVNTEGLDAFRKNALRKGPSTWADLQKQLQFANEGEARDQATSQAASATAAARDNLAQTGGLSSGARERLARKGASDLLNVGQDVSRQGNVNRMQIGIQDEQNRISQLSQLPTLENQALQPELQKEGMWQNAAETDANRIIQENAQKNNYNQNLYAQQMQAQAAAQQAAATENAGKK